jgi:hypothetical protein
MIFTQNYNMAEIAMESHQTVRHQEENQSSISYIFDDVELPGFFKISDLIVTIIKLPAGEAMKIKTTATYNVTSLGVRTGVGGRHEPGPPDMKIFFLNASKGVLDQWRSIHDNHFFKLTVQCGDNGRNHYHEGHNKLDFYQELAVVRWIIEKHEYMKC